MATKELNSKQKKFVATLKGGPKKAADIAKQLKWDAEEIKSVGQGLIKAGIIEAGANKTLQLVEDKPVKKSTAGKAAPAPKRKAKPEPEDDDDDDDDEDGDPDTDEDDDDADAEDVPEDLEGEEVEIVKVLAKKNAIVVEIDDEEVTLVGDEDVDVTDFEKGQTVTISAEYDAEEDEWTLTAIEGEDADDDADGDEDDDDEDEAPPVKKSSGKKAAPAPAAKKTSKKGQPFSMAYKPIDMLTDEELEERVELATEAAQEMHDEYPSVSEMLMRSVARARKQLTKRSK